MPDPELPIETLLGFTDDELVEYMSRNRRPDGSITLNVRGSDTLPSEALARLAERLK